VTVFIVRRVLLGVAILIAASILVFAATQLLPGNAALAILGKSATPQRLRELDVQLHLNASPVTQYVRWASGILSGHLGTSLANGEPVSTAISARLVNTGFLMFAAALIGIPTGLGVGIVAAYRRDGVIDHGSSLLALGLAALPQFVLALILIVLFGTVVVRLLPPTVDLAPGQRPWDDLSGIALPAITLGLTIFPYVMRIMRAAMSDALASPYAEFARLRGVPTVRLLLRHALPNSFAPAAQATAIALAYLAGGAVVVEYIFAYPGVGQGLVYAVQDRDVPVIQVLTVLLAALYVVLNLLADIITALLSPRVRTGRI
jgi:peptide/nickel transport system permease protein